MLGTINCARLWCLGAVDAGRQLRSTNGTRAANKCDAARGESSKSSERSESAAGLAAWMLQQGSSDCTGGAGQLQAALDAGRNPLILIARHTEWRPGITSRQWAASQLFAHGRWTEAPVIRSRRGPNQQVRACSFLLRRTTAVAVQEKERLHNAPLRTTAASQPPAHVKGVLLHSLSCGSRRPLRAWGRMKLAGHDAELHQPA